MSSATFSPLIRSQSRRARALALFTLLMLAAMPTMVIPATVVPATAAARATPAPAVTAPVVATPAPAATQRQEIVPPPAAPVAAAPTGTTQPLSAEGQANPSPAAPLTEAGRAISWDRLLDPVGKFSLDEVLFPTQQGQFVPYDPWNMPTQNGTLWLRTRLAPQPGMGSETDRQATDGQGTTWLLDLNTVFTGQAPDTPQVWLVAPDSVVGTALEAVHPGLYALPASATGSLYIRSPGVPSPFFMPQLRATGSLNELDTILPDAAPLFFASLFVLVLLRGLLERREWRLWAALYASGVLAHVFWGLPATPRGTVHLLDLPGLLAPGVALLMLPHVGRHLLRSRQHAPFLDMQLILLGMPGLALTLAPLVPGYGWTLRYLPLWPLFMLLLIPTMMGALFKNLPGSRRFLLMCLLPPLTLLLGYALAPLGFIQSTGWLVAGLGYLPWLGLGLSVLCMAFSPTPAWLPLPDAHKKTKETGAGRERQTKALRPEPAESTTSLNGLPPLQSGQDQQGLPDLHVAKNSPAQPPNASTVTDRSLQALEGDLREVLDTVFVNIAALDQLALPQQARDISTALARSGRKFAGLIQQLPKILQGEGDAAPKQATHRFDLRELMLQAHDVVAAKAESKNLALSWFSAPHLHRYFEGDGLMLYKVLTLLGESAVSATQARGMVQIRAQRLSESNDPGQLVFTVIDTGSGMPPFGRSGIALVRAWELVGACGGSLRLDSTPTGTVVTCTLRFKAVSSSLPVTMPVQDASDTDTAASSATGSATGTTSLTKEEEPTPTLRIIVGSDVPANRQLMAYYLDELPHEVLEARSSGEAASLYSRTPGALLVLDGDLPEDDMTNAIATIRAFEGEHNYPPTSIVVLVNEEQQASRLRRAGCTHTLFKPILRTELRHLVLRLAPLPRPRKPVKSVSQPTQAQRQARPVKAAPSRGSTLQNLPDLSLSPKDDARTPENTQEKKRWGLLPSFGRPQDDTPDNATDPTHETPTASAPAAPGSASTIGAVTGQPSPTTKSAQPVAKPLSNVGEPMPIPRSPKASTTTAEDATARPVRKLPPVASPRADWRNDTGPSMDWVGEPVPITKPSVAEPAATISVAAGVRDASVRDASVHYTQETAEWVGEPMPITKTSGAGAEEVGAPVTPASPHRFTSVDAVEWVGEPMPIAKPSVAAQPATPAPVSTSVAASVPAPARGQAPVQAQSYVPLDAVEWVGEPMPIPKAAPVTTAKLPIETPMPSAVEVAKSLSMATDVEPASHHDSPLESAFMPMDAVEWVGEPMPVPTPVAAPLTPADKFRAPEDNPSDKEAPLMGGFYLAFEPEEAFDKPLPEESGPSANEQETQPLSLLPVDDLPAPAVGRPRSSGKTKASAAESKAGRASRGPKRLHLPGPGLPDLLTDPDDDDDVEPPVITLFERVDDPTISQEDAQQAQPPETSNGRAGEFAEEFIVTPVEEVELALQPEEEGIEAPTEVLPQELPAELAETAGEAPVEATLDTPAEEPVPSEGSSKGYAEASSEALAGGMARLVAAFDDVETGINASNAGAVLAAASALAMLAEELHMHMLAGQARCMEDLADSGDVDIMREFLPELQEAVARLKEEFAGKNAE